MKRRRFQPIRFHFTKWPTSYRAFIVVSFADGGIGFFELPAALPAEPIHYYGQEC